MLCLKKRTCKAANTILTPRSNDRNNHTRQEELNWVIMMNVTVMNIYLYRDVASYLRRWRNFECALKVWHYTARFLVPIHKNRDFHIIMPSVWQNNTHFHVLGQTRSVFEPTTSNLQSEDSTNWATAVIYKTRREMAIQNT